MEASEQRLYLNMAEHVGKLVIDKQIAYGDSFGKTEEVMKVLYPNGIELNQYKDMLTVVRIIDKLFRIATDRDAFGESPWKDINGYSLLALVKGKREE